MTTPTTQGEKPICEHAKSEREYVLWHEWAEELTKNKVDQIFCPVCEKYYFPTEFAQPTCDNARHLICVPYNIPVLHKIAHELGIKKHWFHRDHYDIPKKRIKEITLRCNLVDSKEIVLLIARKH